MSIFVCLTEKGHKAARKYLDQLQQNIKYKAGWAVEHPYVGQANVLFR